VNSSFAEAINTVLLYIDDMFGYLKQEHEAAKTSLTNNDCEDIKECYKKVNNTHLNLLKSIADYSRSNHTRCRQDQYECCKQREENPGPPGTICNDYKVVRNNGSFPECFSDRDVDGKDHLNNDYICVGGECSDRQEDGDLDKMEECLVKVHEWFDPVYSNFKDCDWVRDCCDDVNDTCGKNQSDFEGKECMYTNALIEDCEEWKKCWNDGIDDCDQECRDVSAGVEIRKAENETGERVRCLLKVLLLNGTGETRPKLDACKNKTYDLSYWDITCQFNDDGVWPPALNDDVKAQCHVDDSDQSADHKITEIDPTEFSIPCLAKGSNNFSHLEYVLKFATAGIVNPNFGQVYRDFECGTDECLCLHGQSFDMAVPEDCPGSSWTPAAINTELWLDASELSTITKNDNKVEAWKDLSGHGRDVSGEGSTKPSYLESGFNGMPCVQFEAPAGVHGETLMSGAAIEDSPSGGEWSVFVVVDDQSNDGENWLFTVAGNVEERYMLGTQGAQYGYNGVYGAKAQFVTGEQLLNYEVARQNKIYRNGKLVSEKTIISWVDQSWNGRARGLRVGSRGSGHAGMNGKIAELVAVFGVPSTGDRERIEGYLAWKWGLQANLPEVHPYKMVAPTHSNQI